MWKFRHVKGRQDNHALNEELDLWEKLNNEMDSRAKCHMEIAKWSPQHYMIAAEPLTL
jgi:hypothetical protein